MFILIGMVVLCLLIVIAFFSVLFAPSVDCPRCDNRIKFAKNGMKCPHCKARVYKKKDGTIEVAN